MFAAGTGAACGIPGVSRPRPAVPSISIGQLELVVVPECPRKSIQASKWWQRGWTYQEGVLSRRRVIFTEGSIYYECGGMVASESYRLPPRNLHTRSLLNQETFICGGVLSGTFDESPKAPNSFRFAASSRPEARHTKVLGHLENYSHRELSYNTDILHAFRGILSAHEVEDVFGLVLGYYPNIWDAFSMARGVLC